MTINDVELQGDEDEAIGFILGHLEAGTFRKPVLEAWLRERASPA